MTYDEFTSLYDYEQDEWFLKAYDNHTLSDDPLWREIFEDVCYGEWFEIVNRDREEDRRWSAWINIIFKVKDRYFRIGYDMGLTEYQENDYDDKSVVEVHPVERQITITDWIEK